MPSNPSEQINRYVERQNALKERARQLRAKRAQQVEPPKVVDDIPKPVRKQEEQWDGTLPGYRHPPSTSKTPTLPPTHSDYYYSPPKAPSKRISKSTLSSSLQLLKSLQSKQERSPNIVSGTRRNPRPVRRPVPEASSLPESSTRHQPEPQVSARRQLSSSKPPSKPPVMKPPAPVEPISSSPFSPSSSLPPEIPDGPTEPFVQCKVCGRNFAQSRIQKHSSICKKQATKTPRKPFNSTKHRLPEEALEVGKSGDVPSAKKSKWREQRAQLQAAMRSVKTGGPPPPVVKDDRVACRYCGRKFAEDRVEKHEGICAKQAQRKQMLRGSRGRRK
ncbi:hypothetical protein GEMRC1_002442 [Eukaryota sp. GEM-RC1]